MTAKRSNDYLTRGFIKPIALVTFIMFTPLSYMLLSEAVVWRCSVKNVFWKFREIHTRKHLCQSLFFNKVAGLRSATLFKKRLWHKCFPVNFAKFLRTFFFTEHLRSLLLHIGLFSCFTFQKIHNSIFVLHWKKLNKTIIWAKIWIY